MKFRGIKTNFPSLLNLSISYCSVETSLLLLKLLKCKCCNLQNIGVVPITVLYCFAFQESGSRILASFCRVAYSIVQYTELCHVQPLSIQRSFRNFSNTSIQPQTVITVFPGIGLRNTIILPTFFSVNTI